MGDGHLQSREGGGEGLGLGVHLFYTHNVVV